MSERAKSQNEAPLYIKVHAEDNVAIIVNSNRGANCHMYDPIGTDKEGNEITLIMRFRDGRLCKEV
ncbi:hypothetical protein QFZ77_006234 [Paenibacillus sp. V4I3]|uniref:hypothetical protein n=1 Tax=Paenibacillus sp. V4I3 TaxID=3042305 RepID=UPI00277D2A87|nr:hypothetical protein [Paenibacillus sp. V4I3]MDQ0877575.1 hypothetical protein [Paenibacillus sp. V4I3]